jgi:hypothetical protein
VRCGRFQSARAALGARRSDRDANERGHGRHGAPRRVGASRWFRLLAFHSASYVCAIR